MDEGTAGTGQRWTEGSQPERATRPQQRKSVWAGLKQLCEQRSTSTPAAPGTGYRRRWARTEPRMGDAGHRQETHAPAPTTPQHAPDSALGATDEG